MVRGMKYISVLLLVLIAGAAYAASSLELPKDHRRWLHVRSMVITDKSSALYGFHHVYVEPKAEKAYRAGKGYAEGAMFAVPFYEVVSKDGTIDQGALKMTAVMKKDKSAAETGGWRYAAFDPSGKMIALDVKTACYDCHASQKDRDYVFSKFAD